MILTDDKLKEFAHPNRGNDAKKLMASELLEARRKIALLNDDIRRLSTILCKDNQVMKEVE